MTKRLIELSPSDYIEIHQLYAKYSFALDLGDGPGRAAVFTSDGTFNSSSNNHHPDSIQTMAERTTKTGNQGRRHLMMNIVVTPTPEGASGRAYAVILIPSNEDSNKESSLKGITGFYVDSLVKTSDGWRFRTREFWNDKDPDSSFRHGAVPPSFPWR